MSVVLGLAFLAFWLYCLFDVITTPDNETRNLPKVLWVLIVVVVVGFGGLLWLLLGRPRGTGATQAPPERPAARPEGPRGPDDDPDFLRDLERRMREED
ncbi:PLDc N-terminal domain-containing protein [Microtetraspora sp. NBRC 13810]|uniref:PLDc N-terminal domain-containing protein n=1 Tax=Microtetraspora sp. NBRC 13810 TaxID=3030990 RepID=UPI00255428ED|nr:PLDc N-terminal domain-containing protein [Microtetraspora sp. NBRC 13810]